MKRTRITLKNYRGFSDAQPVRIEIGPGFTALVGRNNSGKSAFKLFFYEVRRLFEALQNDLNVNPSLSDVLVQNWAYSVNYQGISDNNEIFNNTNDRPLVVEIEVLQPSCYAQVANVDSLARVVMTCDRSSPNVWRFAAFSAGSPQLDRTLSQRGRPGANAPSRWLSLQNCNLDCADFMDAMRALANARYYGPFRNAINQGAGEHYDLRVGTSFIELWNAWKTGGNRAQMRAIDQVTDDIRRLFEFSRLEINTSTSLNTLIVSIDGEQYRLNELGSGLAQFIMVFGNAATNPASLLLIDEPETNLHPALQIDFLLALGQYARDGVVFSTHSIGLARSVADWIYSVQKRPEGTVVKPFEATPNYIEFVGELSFSSFKELGSDRLLLVEGVHDVKVLQQLLRLVKKEHTTVILQLGGDQMVAIGREDELRELSRLSNNIFAFVDSERENADGPPSERRVRFAETCHKIGIDVCLTERRAIENYFPDKAIKSALGDGFSALAPFELLKAAQKPWSKRDNWKIARQMELADIDSTDLGKFLRRI